MIDAISYKVLKELRKDSRLSVREIAGRVNVTSTTVHRKIKQMVKNKVIKRFTIDFDWAAIERTTTAYIMVSLDHRMAKNRKQPLDFIVDKFKKHPMVLDCATITGSRDMMIKIKAKNTEEMHHFVNYVRTFEEVVQTETHVGLYESKELDNVFG